MDWFCSLQILLATILVGNKMWQGWLVYALGVIPWSILIYQKQLWGLIPITVVSLIIHSTYMVQWYRAGSKHVAD